MLETVIQDSPSASLPGLRPGLRPDFRPKGLYIHVPFCASNCPYCDFYVIVLRDQQAHLDFVERLIEQLDSYLAQQPELLCQLETIFLGGGTPSLLGTKALSSLMAALEQRLSGGLAGLREISMESNPELIQRDSLQLWQDLGISRLSIGLQSCNDRLLKLLGRRSLQQQHERLAATIPQYFRGEYSFDFIYAIPGQELCDIRKSLDFVRRHQPHHVSYYELGIEEETVFGRWGRQGRLASVAESQSEEQFALLCQGLEDLGYWRYEVSNFARLRNPTLATSGGGSGESHWYLSRHNQLYWRWQPYLGLGPSAVGAGLLVPEGQAGGKAGGRACVWRMQGTRDWQSYLQRSDFGVSYSQLSEAESLWEYLLMALRLRRGIDAGEFASLFWPGTPRGGRELLEQSLQGWLPQTMADYAHFFEWRARPEAGPEAGPETGEETLRLSDAGFDLQGAFLRAAYCELGL